MRATSYGASSCRHSSSALRSGPSALRASPRTSSTAPPAQPVDLPAPVSGIARGSRIFATNTALHRPARLGQRVRPGALELHDLGAVHEAAARARHELRLALTPGAERRRPLPRAPEL